jgi:hypothetical protein
MRRTRAILVRGPRLSAARVVYVLGLVARAADVDPADLGTARGNLHTGAARVVDVLGLVARAADVHRAIR